MDIATILSAATGYILSAIAQSQTAQNVKEEVLGRFWKWMKPSFLAEIPAIEAQPAAPETTVLIQGRLQQLINCDEAFLPLLKEHLAALAYNPITEKCIVRGDIKGVRYIRIGDKECLPDEPYDRKSIVEGSISDADEFILGDGH